MLPKDFPPWQTVYWWFRRFMRRFLFETIHDVALMIDRERAGREVSSSAGVIESQSVKAPAEHKRGYDAGKKVVGHKRHIAVDTDGRLLMVNLTTADIADSAGAQAILDAVRKRWPWAKPPDTALRTQLRELANEVKRFIYRRFFVLLRQMGEPSGINRTYRLYREEARERSRRFRGVPPGVGGGHSASGPLERWPLALRSCAHVQGPDPAGDAFPVGRALRIPDQGSPAVHALSGLSLADGVPDANTIWTFREALKKADAVEVLFREFDEALRSAGFPAMSGQIVDATIVAAPKQRNTIEEKKAIKEGRVPEEWKDARQKDRDARWTVKYTKAKPREDGSTPAVDLAALPGGWA
jgi:transposase